MLCTRRMRNLHLTGVTMQRSRGRITVPTSHYPYPARKGLKGHTVSGRVEWIASRQIFHRGLEKQIENFHISEIDMYTDVFK